MRVGPPTSHALIALASAFLVPTLSFATPIAGSFNFGGSTATVAATSLTFNCAAGIGAAPCPGPAGTGNFNTTGGTGDLASYVGQGGYIQSMSQATTPPNSPFLLTDWITFSSEPGNPVASPDIALDLEFLFLGVSGQADCAVAPADGQTCTPIIPALITPENPLGLSPYNLQNTPTGSTASFSVRGTARRVSTGEESAFTGTFSAPFLVPYQTLLASLADGSITSAYSGTIVIERGPTGEPEIPEPSTVSMAIGGLLLLVGAARRKAAQK